MADEDGWRWMILVESFFTLFFNTGISFTNGVLFVALKETFDDGDKLEWITWIGSVYLSMTALGGPLCSFIINVFDSRVCILLSGIFGLVGFVTSSLVSDIKLLFLTYSLMSGFSVCLSSCGALVILCYYFKDRAGIATAFSLTGVGMGAFIYPRLTRELIDKYGLSGTFLFLGGFSFQACVFGSLMRPSVFEQQKKNKGGTKPGTFPSLFTTCCRWTANLDIFKNKSFLFFLCAIFCTYSGTFTIFLFLPMAYEQWGASPQEAALAASIAGLGDVLSRIFVGIASTEPKAGNDLFFSCSAGIVGILTLFVPFLSQSTTGRFLYAALLGLYCGGNLTLVCPLTHDILGTVKVASGYGTVSAVTGMAFLIGPPIAGEVLKYTGYYQNIFLLCGRLSREHSTTVCNCQDCM